MIKIKLQTGTYYTNIVDSNKLTKCFDFFSSGCTSYVVSFDNKKEHIRENQRLDIDGIKCLSLKNCNFNCIFVPHSVAEFNTAKELMENGMELIEII